jgi:hypothetical protein
VTREARIPRPVARVAPLVEHCRALLDGWALTAPISAVAVAVTRTASASAEQGDLLDGGWRDPGAADAAFARLRSALGAGTVVRPVARDEHRPERAGGWDEHQEPERGGRGVEAAPGRAAGAVRGARFSPHEPLVVPNEQHVPHLTAALRLLEAPEPIDVEHTAGVPSAFWWRGCRLPVESASGPERLSGDWWRDGYARDYWRCAGAAGEFLIYLDRARRWYLQGWYD